MCQEGRNAVKFFNSTACMWLMEADFWFSSQFVIGSSQIE